MLSSAWALSGTVNSSPSDAQANSDGTVSYQTITYGRVGADAGLRHSVVHVFQIPAAVLNDPSQEFATASYSTKLGQGSAMTVNSDLYGLDYSSSSSVLAGDFWEAPSDPANTLIHDNFITPSTPAYATLSTSGSALVNYLNAALRAARSDGATSACVFLRHNLEAYVWSGVYIIGMSEAGGSAVPTLSYTTQTVSGWNTVPLGGGGYVTGLVSTSTGTIYCRSDVGGCFRWIPDADGVNGVWKSLSDAMVPYDTTGANQLMQVDGIGIDPSNSNLLYVGAGGRYASELHGIFASGDQGNTWTQINTTIRMNGNGAYRSHGERLAVDPNNANILWYGSTQDGLQKLTKNGSSWTATQIPASSVPLGLSLAGVTFVVCDRNDGANTIVYAGVYDASAGGIYRSSDGGASWAKVGGAAITAPKRAQLAPNGTLYTTAGTSGVFKLNRGGTIVQLSSLPAVDASNAAINYHAVAIDPSDAAGNTVYVAQNKASAGMIWRSTDGGTTWSKQDTVFNEGPLTQSNHARREPDGTTCLTGYWFGATAALLVPPARPNELWLGDFFGVSRTANAQALGTNPGSWWYTLQKGQEETCVLDVLNAPSGPRLMTGMGDVGGYRYTDTSVRPTGTGGNIFRTPSGGNNTSLDFCESNPGVWARAWVYQNLSGSAGSGAVSSDGGVNWLTFGQVAARTVTNSGTGGWET